MCTLYCIYSHRIECMNIYVWVCVDNYVAIINFMTGDGFIHTNSYKIIGKRIYTLCEYTLHSTTVHSITQSTVYSTAAIFTAAHDYSAEILIY